MATDDLNAPLGMTPVSQLRSASLRAQSSRSARTRHALPITRRGIRSCGLFAGTTRLRRAQCRSTAWPPPRACGDPMPASPRPHGLGHDVREQPQTPTPPAHADPQRPDGTSSPQQIVDRRCDGRHALSTGTAPIGARQAVEGRARRHARRRSLMRADRSNGAMSSSRAAPCDVTALVHRRRPCRSCRSQLPGPVSAAIGRTARPRERPRSRSSPELRSAALRR